jgi:hypothetical protein
MPLNYFTFQGLRRYGFDREAEALARRSEELFVAQPFREYYLTETGAGMGREEFVGWSGLALYMRDECERAIDPTALDASPLPRAMACS